VKKKLLITMGCSFTEGVGCYDTSKMDELVFYALLPKEQYKYQVNNFHELGWPNRLGKKLGYDKVINLGLGGSSISGQVKQFSEKYLDKDFSEYDVLLVWLLTDPSRISFYSNGEIKNIVSNSNQPLYNEYVKILHDINLDTILEQIFYIKVMEQICENKGYSLLLTSMFSDNDIYSIYDSKYFLNSFHPRPIIFGNEKYWCNIPLGDKHLNEDGYEAFADELNKNIRTYHSHLTMEYPKDEIEWIWDGNPKKLEQLI
jgi:hypothetical protein